MDPKELADRRRNYSKSELSESAVSADPFEQFSAWMDKTLSSGILEPNAMVLSTADAAGRPSSRVVLLKGFDQNGFVFFTNYESRKARELTANPQASMLFFWPELERQINISGTVDRISRERSDTYFRSRPLDSRIGAWASKQSSKIASRIELEDRFASLKRSYSDGEVPLPPFWGGFRLAPDRFEFWQGRSSRLHDRICYELAGAKWVISRLSP